MGSVTDDSPCFSNHPCYQAFYQVLLPLTSKNKRNACNSPKYLIKWTTLHFIRSLWSIYLWLWEGYCIWFRTTSVWQYFWVLLAKYSATSEYLTGQNKAEAQISQSEICSRQILKSIILICEQQTLTGNSRALLLPPLSLPSLNTGSFV